jgi:flagellar hook-basal body complex protein FliE
VSNLNVENLGRIVQGGNTEELFASHGNTAASELKAAQEMKANGMDAATSEVGEAGGSSFGEMLKSSINKVNEMQAQSDTAIGELIAGRTKNIHETMLAIERADTSLKLAMQVRNKILDAYREIMRMQV